MVNIKNTRGELILVRKRISLARSGYTLLKRKQDAMVVEFLRVLGDLQKKKNELQKEFQRAQQKSNEVRTFHSDVKLNAASLAAQEVAPVTITMRRIAGVLVPILSREKSSHTVYESLSIQDVAASYIKVLDRLAQIAAQETTLRRLLLEIKKTKRRTHAIDTKVIPQLVQTKKKIEFEISERDREQHGRIKMKKILSEKNC